VLNPAPILCVEDSEDDQFFLKRACDAAGIQNTIHFLDDGQKAIDYFSFQGPYADRQRYAIPCLIILDLKLPKYGLGVEGIQAPGVQVPSWSFSVLLHCETTWIWPTTGVELIRRETAPSDELVES
jgi:hypothetical protein